MPLPIQSYPYPSLQVSNTAQADQDPLDSAVATSYFPPIPPPHHSYFPPSAPVVCSPLPLVEAPRLPRRPSSAGERFGSGHHVDIRPLSATAAAPKVPAQVSPVAPTAPRRIDPQFKAYAASRIAQAAAATSAAKESAVARLHAKHQAWSRLAHIQTSSLPVGSTAHSTSKSHGSLADLQHRHQRAASAVSAQYAKEVISDFSTSNTTSGTSSSSSDQKSSSSFGYIDYASIDIPGLSPTPPPSRPGSFPSRQSGSASSSAQPLTPLSATISNGSGHGGVRPRASTGSFPNQKHDPTTGITPNISQRSDSIWTADLAPRPRHYSTSAASSLYTSPQLKPYRANTTKTQGAPKMADYGAGIAGPSSAISLSPTSVTKDSAGGGKEKKKKTSKDVREREGKRKKVSKACLACQKSHLTCDEQRPCTRCVKKGLSDQCVEGVRKKAKYLLEADERGSPDHSESPPSYPNLPPDLTAPTLQTSLSSTSIPGLSNLTDTSLLSNLNPGQNVNTLGSGSGLGMDMNLNTIAGLPSLTSTGVYSLDSTLDPPGMDVWLAPAPAQQTLVDADTSFQREAEGRAGSPLMGMGKDDWGNLFGGAGVGGGNSFGFGTTATNEYAMLDAMLNSMSPVFPFDLGADGMQMDLDNLGASTGNDGFGSFSNNETSGMQQRRADLGMPGQTMMSSEWPTDGPVAGFTPPGGVSGQAQQRASISAPGSKPIQGLWDWSQQHANTAGSMGQGYTAPIQQQVGQSLLAQPQNQVQPSLSGGGAFKTEPESPKLATHTAAAAAAAPVQAKAGPLPRLKSGAEVYHSVTKPFDYTEGYHILMEWMSKSFEQKEVLRVVKALAAFRPSLIALQMPMSEEDEVFLERSFQRTLIELEKLISYSATPTAVWRRTGDLVYANPEFCSLLGKQQSELLSGKTYIYHLFAKQSVITYWENFSVHAFENTTQNFFQPTTLQIAGKQTACSCCFTIRRDVFDLPSVIIGQFLPIPTE